MANKYIDVSATNNGDGTTSAQATVAGGIGAWNSLIAAASGVPGYGSVDAGDKVYIRTADSGGALSVTTTSALVFAENGTKSAPVYWIFDDGTIWAESGVFIFTTVNPIFHDYNVLYGNNNLTIIAGKYSVTDIHGVSLYNLTLTQGDTGTTGSFIIELQGADTPALFQDVSFIPYQISATGAIFTVANYQSSYVVLNDCTFDLRYKDDPVAIFSLLSTNAGSVDYTINGGEILGATTNDYLYDIVPRDGALRAVTCNGLNTGGDINVENVSQDEASTISAALGAVANLQEGYKFTYEDGLIRYNWTAGLNYPTLNATLPDGLNTPWSIQVYPKWTDKGRPSAICPLSKFYNQSASTGDITVEILPHTSYGTPTKDLFWIVATYIDDTTGAPKTVSSFDPSGGNLSASTSGWSSTVYGAENYQKFKIEVTTPTAIKENTEITITLFSGQAPDIKPPSVSTDYYFVCPDFQVA